MTNLHRIAVAFLALASGACIMPGQKPALGGAASLGACGPEGLIDDAEDNNHQGAVLEGRGGYWYTYVDESGSTISPTAGTLGGTFNMSEGGASGTKFAANAKGSLSGGVGAHAGMGMNLTDPKDTYDVSNFGGVAFWAKKTAGAGAKVRFKMPDINTDEEGGVCKECFNDFGVDLNLTDDWKQYVILFFKLRQQEGWGSPRLRKIERGKVFALQWQPAQPGPFDIWVDEIQFVGCE